MSMLSVCRFQNVGNYILCCLFNNFIIRGLMTRPPCEQLQAKVRKYGQPAICQVSASWPLASGPPSPSFLVVSRYDRHFKRKIDVKALLFILPGILIAHPYQLVDMAYCRAIQYVTVQFLQHLQLNDRIVIYQSHH